jgi:hypothetical protein
MFMLGVLEHMFMISTLYIACSKPNTLHPGVVVRTCRCTWLGLLLAADGAMLNTYIRCTGEVAANQRNL